MSYAILRRNGMDMSEQMEPPTFRDFADAVTWRYRLAAQFTDPISHWPSFHVVTVAPDERTDS